MTYMLITVGLIMGCSSGLLGIGGGVILVPALIWLLDLSPQQAVATSLAVIIPTALSGALKHYSAGNIDFKIVAIVAVGGVIGGYLGASVANFISTNMLKKAFGIFLVFMGLNMLFNWTQQIRYRGKRL